MGKLLKVCLTTLSAMLILSACSSEEDDPVVLKLSADKSAFTANGMEKVTFTVTLNSEDVTSSAAIHDAATGTKLPGASFSTTEPGDYTFYAMHRGAKSEIITITAKGVVSLTADKTEFIPDGKDRVTFTVTSAGVDVTSSSKIKNTVTGEYLDGTTFTSTNASPVKFLAEYGGSASREMELIPKPFYHTVCMFKFTNTGCGPCYFLSQSLNTAVAQLSGRLTYVNIHTSGPLPSDPMRTTESVSIQNTFSVTGVPDCLYDLKDRLSGTVPASAIVNKVNYHEATPSASGIRASASVDAGKATLTVTVWVNETKNYYLGAMLLEDDFAGTQYNNSSFVPYTHDKVFRKLLSENVLGDALGEIKADGVVSKTYTVDLSGYNADNCYFMIYSLCDGYVDGKAAKIIDNSAYCKPGETVDFLFEE